VATVYLGLGANLGDRSANLEAALERLAALARAELRLSSVYETPALLPEGAPESWNRPYWNLVAALEFEGSPAELLHATQRIEADLGRIRGERWAPRPIDLDLLHWEGVTLATPTLTLPHPGIRGRAFVLDPLAELAPGLRLPGGSGMPDGQMADEGASVLELARRHPKHQPRLMGILNVTPDSFSDGGKHAGLDAALAAVDAWSGPVAPILDVGGESTRPGAGAVSPDEEWARIRPLLEALRARFAGRRLRPRISVDTRRAEVAARALALGADWINDVSGGADPALLELVRAARCTYVVMHSLTVPADPRATLGRDHPPAAQLRRWFEAKLAELDRAGIARDRVVLDPGIGFGKTPFQSLEVLRDWERFLAPSLGVPVLAGHSRKSFLKDFSSAPAPSRDPETLGVSLALAAKGADLLRVHDPVLHHRALLAWSHVR
jgi:2-amino-4-hydroxy-6-hydroxymethyldihydropteridine diphosphokinase/dihydropteroate synthase